MRRDPTDRQTVLAVCVLIALSAAVVLWALAHEAVR